MAQLNVKRHIKAPPAIVFRYFADLRNAAGRIKNIHKLDVLTDGPIRQGTKFRETRVVFGREATETMEILAFDAPNSYMVGCESCGCRYRSTFRFKPAAGGTDVEFTFEVEPLTWMARVMGVLMAPMMKKCMAECAKDVDDLGAAILSDSGLPSGGPATAPA